MRLINYIRRKLAEFIYPEIQILEGKHYTSTQKFPEVEELKKELKEIFNTD